MRQQVRTRRDVLLESLRASAPELHVEHAPRGGLNLWARLPDAVDVAQAVRGCEARGVVIAPGTEWFPAEPSGPFVRLNFAAEEPAPFAEAAHVLGEVILRAG